MKEKLSSKIRKSVRDTYDSIASEFDQTRQYKWHEFDYFAKLVNKNSKVLDLGCGNGRLYDVLKEKKVDYTGVDQSSGMIEKARENHPGVSFEVGDMADLNFPDQSFDVLFSVASFHHLPGRPLRKQSAAEMRRLLKKNGILILTVWNLFQWKYFSSFLLSFASSVIHLGTKTSWNDLWIKWGHSGHKRYYHAFLPAELRRLFDRRHWKIEEMYFTKKGTRVNFLRSFNICLIARKK